ncbi:GyrI-like domain-containing protein [Candidatus Odyssella thessalonicensis]|uniref:GyrI-like domain-containing protein n=1 Tax=Candidatus Odyssella thessalonicensis TaxID=84647 RepID=UPI000225A8E0|nr:GyrI-like domain-containing protein [Candidatus Odyssella thessalonicensis]
MMQQISVMHDQIYLVGQTCRTNNTQEMEQATAKIGPLFSSYFSQNLADQICNRKHPGTTYCVYTEYESDMAGNYTVFIGEEVTTLDQIPSGYASLIIPSQHYKKFTTQAGEMPAVCISAWQEIWQMSPQELGGQRAYQADFEVYDHRAQDPFHTVLDIYIGLKG